MDLRLYGRVISRFRWLVVGGMLLAVVLGCLTMFRIDTSHKYWVAYRQQLTYQASETLLLSAKNCPPAVLGCTNVDLSSNAVLYARIANSGLVRARVLRQGPLNGTYAATEISGGSAVGILPLVEIDALSHDPHQAAQLATRVANALVAFLRSDANGVASSRVVDVQTITKPVPFVAKGRKYTIPIVLFLSVLLVTLGLAFLLENLRPRLAEPRRERHDLRGDRGLTAPVRDVESLDREEQDDLEPDVPVVPAARAAAGEATRSGR